MIVLKFKTLTLISLFGNLIWYICVGSAKIVSATSSICLVVGSEYLCDVCDDEYWPPTLLKNWISEIDIITTYFSPLDRQLGQNVVVSELRRLIQAENGVISISDMRFFNKVGGQYSSFQTSQPYSNVVTKQIELVADTIFAEPSQIYQIKFPTKDILVRVLNLKTVSFS